MFDLKDIASLLLGSTNGELYFVRTGSVFYLQNELSKIKKS